MRRLQLFRTIAFSVIGFGMIFGMQIKSTGFCMGDQLLMKLGIDPYNGFMGLRYSAGIGLLLVMGGLGVVSGTVTNQKDLTRMMVFGMGFYLMLQVLANFL